MAENKDGQYDMELMRQIKEHGTYLKSIHQQRNSMFTKMEQMLLMEWDEESRVRTATDNVKITKHPGARNKLMGALRLMVATDPLFNVPKDASDPTAAGISEKIEHMAEAMWTCAGRVRQQPVHYDVVLSCLTFAEMHIAVTKTSDMVEAAKGGTKAAMAKAEEIAAITPYLFDVWDPRTGYPEIGPQGLTSFYREVETTSGAVLDEFGDAAREVIQDPKKRYDKVTLCHFWDYENHVVWLTNSDRPLIQEAHGLSFIPVVVQLGEGSRLFEKPEHQRQPFLYTLWQSGLWARQNLMLTVLYTLAFSIGSNPLYVYQANQPGKQLNIDWSRPGGTATIEANESLGPLAKQVIDPSLLQGREIADGLEEESTIYGQTLGQPLGPNATFSETSLLHQAGRLPLITTQRMASWAIADAVKMALKWMKADKTAGKARYKGAYTELKPSEIPERFELEAMLDIDLPQDMLQQANVANQLTAGENPLASQEWTRENILKIGQPKEMQKQIWGEQAAAMLFYQFLEDQMQVMQQRQQMEQMQQQGQPGQPPQGGQGIPPEMMQGGMQPPETPMGQNPNAAMEGRIPPELMR